MNYKGGAPAVRDLLAGRTQVMFAQIPDVMGQLRDGRLRAIAVTTPKRTAILPDVPTLAESGFPRFSFSGWQAVFGTAGMPREVVARLNREIVMAMSTQEMKDRFRSIGADAATSTPQELGAFIAEEMAKIGRIAGSVGAKVH